MAIMKVSEIPYKRYTLEEGQAAFAAFETAMKNAKCAEDVLAARKAFNDEISVAQTAMSLGHSRFTLDTRNEFYAAEMKYYDEVGPHFSELSTKYADLMLSSPYREELEKSINPRLFKMWEIQKKTFDPCIIEECQEENAITTAYSKLMSEMKFSFRGEEMPLSRLRGKLEDADREVRREAAEAIGRGLEANEKELDDIYDRLVKLRTKIAQKLGYKTFTELGYYRMGRLDYNAEMVAAFRDNVCASIVPVVKKVKGEIAKSLGNSETMFYDDAIYTTGDSIVPKGGKEEMFAAAKDMYNAMNPEIGAFMEEMLEAEAFDVDSRDGKWGGGYCTVFDVYKQPFILANFNGTTGDVDVLTHEFGHAFAMKKVFDRPDTELGLGGSETAECHSMSMEFLCWPYMDSFFGADADRYRRKHLLSAISFIPYGVMVDEFQHEVYENPNMTPAERKALWVALEKKYRPYMQYDDIPYLSKGTRWQYQMHIYESPFYYIDYCIAQSCALQYKTRMDEDYKEAWASYLKLCRLSASDFFTTMVKEVGLKNPLEDGCLEDVVKKMEAKLQL